MDNTTLMQIRAALERIQADAAAAISLIPTSRLVRAGESLQAALDQGGVIELEAGATFEGNYRLRVPGTRVLGASAALRGVNGGAAIIVPVGVRDVQCIIGTATTLWDDAVVQIGENTSRQTTAEDAPSDIIMTVGVPSHRGKRAFSVHGRNVTLRDCSVFDVYDPAGRDSQAIWIGNAPGNISVLGGTFEAGSENVLVGGAVLSIPGLNPTGLLFDGVTLRKPLSWKTDGINRKVKNLFELKSGIDVTLKNATLDGCWVAGQQGYALVVTPRNGSTIQNVLYENLTIRNVSEVMQLLGYDDSAVSGQTRDITLRRIDSEVSRTLYGGTGRFASWSSEPANITIEDCTHVGDGSSTFYLYAGLVVQADGTRRTGGPHMGVKIQRNTMSFQQYGMFTIGGLAYARDWKLTMPDGIIENNTFSGAASATRANLPNNTFI